LAELKIEYAKKGNILLQVFLVQKDVVAASSNDTLLTILRQTVTLT